MEKGQRLGWVQWVPKLKFGILNEDDWRRGSRERVTEDKIGGGGWDGVYDCRDRRLHPRPGRSVGTRSKENANGLRKPAGNSFNTP